MSFLLQCRQPLQQGFQLVYPNLCLIEWVSQPAKPRELKVFKFPRWNVDFRKSLEKLIQGSNFFSPFVASYTTSIFFLNSVDQFSRKNKFKLTHKNLLINLAFIVVNDFGSRAREIFLLAVQIRDPTVIQIKLGMSKECRRLKQFCKDLSYLVLYRGNRNTKVKITACQTNRK